MLTAVIDEVEDVDLSEKSMISSPREATSTLLFLSRLVEGHTCNDDADRILKRLDPTLSISSANWMYNSPQSMTKITGVISHPSVTNCVADHMSLASALLDAVAELVKCCRYHLRSEEDDHQFDSWTLKEESVLEILICLVHLLGCPAAYGLSSQAREILQEFSCCFVYETDSDTKQSLLDVHFRQLVSKLTADSSFPWKETDAPFIALTALLQASKGSTVSSNFDLVAPFFLHHMSAKDGEAEDYTMRIKLMSLLQLILSDVSFHHSPLECASAGGGNSTTSSVFTTETLFSLVLPNLVWRPGGLAAALRKLSVATVFSLLRHLLHSSTEISEMLTQFIPILHSCLDDTENSSRELACLCLSMVMEKTPPEIFQSVWKADARVIDTLQPRLLSLLDDNHNPVRLAACKALKSFLTLTNSIEKTSSPCDRKLPSWENIVSIMTAHLDDDEKDVQEEVLDILRLLAK